MEPVGLALGAIALIGPTISTYRKCSAVFMDTRKYAREFRRYFDILQSEEQIFVNECTLILSSMQGLDRSLALEMINNSNHERWKCPELQERWSKHCKHFRTPMETALENLQKMEKKVDLLLSKINDDLISKSTTLERAKLCKFKTFWQFGNRKQELEELIKTIEVDNARLTRLREQHYSLFDAPRTPLNMPSVSEFINVDQQGIKKVARISKISKALYDGMATTVKCPCHTVHLQLQDIFKSNDNSSNSKPFTLSKLEPGNGTTDLEGAKFRMVVTHEDINQPDQASCISDFPECRCTSILVTSEFLTGTLDSNTISARENQSVKRKASITTKGAKRVRFTSSQSPEPAVGSEDTRIPTNTSFYIEGTSTSASSETFRVTSSSVGIGKKRRLDIELPPGKRIRIEIEDQAESLNLTTLSPQSTSEISTIDDLCTLMAKLEAGPTTSECLGYISYPSTPAKDSVVYRHSVYKDVATEPLRAARTSLAQVLSSTSTVPIYTQETYHMAHLLALSLVSLGSTPNTWFVEGWGSEDVQFFLPGIEARKDDELLDTLKPFVMPTFSIQRSNRPKNHSRKQPLARDPQLFSLAIVLIELVFGKPLGAIKIPGLSEQKPLETHLDVFSHAKAILDTALLKRQAGLKYSRIVERCFYGDFGLAETSFENERMREIFYSTVIVQLKKRLDSL